MFLSYDVDVCVYIYIYLFICVDISCLHGTKLDPTFLEIFSKGWIKFLEKKFTLSFSGENFTKTHFLFIKTQPGSLLHSYNG